MKIIAYKIFSNRDCYILKTNNRIRVDKDGTVDSVYLTDVTLLNYKEIWIHQASTSGVIYSNLREMYKIKTMYKEIEI